MMLLTYQWGWVALLWLIVLINNFQYSTSNAILSTRGSPPKRIINNKGNIVLNRNHLQKRFPLRKILDRNYFCIRGGNVDDDDDQDNNEDTDSNDDEVEELQEEQQPDRDDTGDDDEVEQEEDQFGGLVDNYDDDESIGKGVGNVVFNKWKNSNNIPFVNMLLDSWRKTPPITQSYLTSIMAITFTMFFFNNNQWPSILSFHLPSFLFKFQFWRLLSGFLFLGQLDLFFPLTLQFVWQHMTQLERLHYKQPEEFVMLLGFGMLTLIVIYSFLGISMQFLGHNLATYLVYIWSRVFEGLDVNFMDMFTLKSEMLPWFFCAQTWLLEQQIPFADLIGIVVGHLYWYLKQKNAIQAPDMLKEWFGQEKIKKLYSQFKEELE